MSSPEPPSDDGASSEAEGLEVPPDAANENPTTDPVEPVEVVDTVDPVDPVRDEPQPVDAPGEAVDPVEAVEPVDAVEAVEPDVPAEPEVPVAAASVALVPVVANKKWTPTKRHRSWSQRLLLGLNCIVILACFAGAIGLLISRHYGNSLARIELASPPGATDATGLPVDNAADPSPVDTSGETPSGGTSAPVETFPPVDPGAKNFLITGADNNACVDPDSPYAAAFGDRETMGERSDTIMLMRVDPDTRRAAVLSFPRDLWVKIDGGPKNRINSAYVRDDPTKLINTLYGEFGLPVDHFIQVDFCAFKVMVEALGGVTVPFAYPARDTHTGLYVAEPGCFTFDGDHALAYVRSRYYQYYEDGEWHPDPASDLGRVSRQQDFLQRVLTSALAKGFNPGVAKDMIKAVQDYIVLDNDLTITRMLEFAGILSDFEPGALATYQIESVPANIGGNSVLEPRIKGENMQAILNIFRGGAELAGAPEQVFDSTTTSTDPDAPPATGSTAEPATPEAPTENVIGIVPPDDMAC